MKRFLCTLLCAAMVFLSVVTQAAYKDINNTGDTAFLSLVSALNIMRGYPDGSFEPEGTLTRAQFSKIATATAGIAGRSGSYTGTSPFYDVPHTHWAAGYIALAAKNKMLSGYPGGAFLPEKPVPYEEAITVLLRILGYTSEDIGGAWPNSYVDKASELSLNAGIGEYTGQALTRLSVARLVYNTLMCKNAAGTQKFIEQLGYKLYDDVLIISSNKEDPAVRAGNYLTTVGTFTASVEVAPFVGLKGNMIVDTKSNSIFWFDANMQKQNWYVVYSNVQGELTVYPQDKPFSQDKLINLKIDDYTTVYYKAEKGIKKDMSSKITMGAVLQLFYDSNDKIEHVRMYDQSSTTDIVTATPELLERLKSENRDAAISKNGVKATYGDLAENDILYLSSDNNIIWASDKKVVGIYENALPTRQQPTKAVVSGVTYDIATNKATTKLGPEGSFKFGDTITLQMGIFGTVCDVVAPSAQKQAIGFLQSTAVTEFTDNDGYKRTNYTAYLVLADGTAQKYVTDIDYEDLRGKVVYYTFISGKAQLIAAEANTKLYGRVNAQSYTLGNARLAKDIKILDAAVTEIYRDGVCKPIFLQRLGGVSLSQKDILYSHFNDNNEVDILCLGGITGDAYDYGLVIKSNVNMSSRSTSVSSSYSIYVNGSLKSFSSSNSAFMVMVGQPVQLDTLTGKLEHMQALTKLDASNLILDRYQINTSIGSYPLSDKLQIYKKANADITNYDYLLIPISDILNQKNLKFAAYYDRAPENGGRIRVIIVE